MRRTSVIGSRLRYQSKIGESLTPFSTFSGSGGDGRGRGRGRGIGGGSPNPRFSFVPPPPPCQPPDPEPLDPLGYGHGRGRSMPLPITPPFPSIASASGLGRGGGVGGGEGRFPFHPGGDLRGTPSPEPNRHVRVGGIGGEQRGSPPRRDFREPQQYNNNARADGGERRGPPPPRDFQEPQRYNYARADGGERRGPPLPQEFQERFNNGRVDGGRFSTESSVPPTNGSVRGGAGRGGPASHYQMHQQSEPNRHGRVGSGGRNIGERVAPPLPGVGWGGRDNGGPGTPYPPQQQQTGPNMDVRDHGGDGGGHSENVARLQPGSEGPGSTYRRVQKVESMSQSEVDRRGRAPQWKSPLEGERGRAGAGGGRGMSGRGMEGGRGRGRGRGMEGGRGRGRGRWGRGEESRRTVDLSVGNNADGESFASRVGFEVMRQLEQGFEEVVSRTMPSPVDEAYSSAIDLNYRLEFEPELLMGDLDSNPDIDDKEPIPLRDALKKAQPFLMAYEGIESHEEWEEIVEETMERVPALKKIVDHYSGRDRVTAKQQKEELEKVAKTLPETVPDSVKQFTDRALLSLQSNPGWEFHKKRQFMGKLVTRLTQHYE